MRFLVNDPLVDQRVLANAANLRGGVGSYFGRASGDSSGLTNVSLANFTVARLP